MFFSQLILSLILPWIQDANSILLWLGLIVLGSGYLWLIMHFKPQHHQTKHKILKIMTNFQHYFDRPY